MTDQRPTIYVVDDDAAVRDAVGDLLESAGMFVEQLSSTEQFLQTYHPGTLSCLVLDVLLPGMNGLQFQSVLEKRGITIPIIFISAHGDIPMASRALKAGAVEFLPKPFQKRELLSAIEEALARDKARRYEEAGTSAVRARFDRLTLREREIMDLVVSGKTNKEIGAILAITEGTVKMHRGHLMEKMAASSLADLVRMSDRLKNS